MNTNDLNEFTAILNGLASMYNQKEPSDFVKEVWTQALMSYDIEAIRQAFSAHVTNPDNGQFMPKPADIVRILDGSTKDRALGAWSKVAEAVRRVGSWESVVFDDPIIHAVVYDMGGWIVLSMKDDKEWDFAANEFVNRYRGYSYRNEAPNYPPVLVGMFEVHNRREGYKSQFPRLVGNPDVARRVMSNGSMELLKISPADHSRLTRISFNAECSFDEGVAA